MLRFSMSTRLFQNVESIHTPYHNIPALGFSRVATQLLNSCSSKLKSSWCLVKVKPTFYNCCIQELLVEWQALFAKNKSL
jgi:hypothetical protein